MPRRKKGSVPNLRLHKPSQQAVVTLSGEDFYYSPWGTKVALARHDRHVSQWLGRGRQPLVCTDDEAAPIPVVELLATYKRFAKGYYRKNGRSRMKCPPFMRSQWSSTSFTVAGSSVTSDP